MSDFQLTALGQIVWEDRYGLKDENGNLVEKNILETFRRVAKAMVSKEKDPVLWEKRFYDIMANKYFCPAGRILAHAGTTHSQLLNCFVLPFEDDSLEEIMETAKNMAITQKFSGGTGFNYSNLRPSGAHIKGVNGRSCGVLGFMNMMSTVSEVIEQGGCFVSDTLIATSTGAKKIKDLKRDDLIFTLSEQGFEIKPCSGAWITQKKAEVWKITTNQNLIIYATKNHPFMPKIFDFSQKNYIKVEDLKSNIDLMTFVLEHYIDKINYKKQTIYDHSVISVEFSHYEDVYNVEVEDTHNYIVCNEIMSTGVVVSNSRRGANLGLLEISHPDIWEYISYKTKHNWDHLREFIDIKDEEKWTAFKFENLYKLQMYNISVGITDEFLHAVKKDTYWPLLWKGTEWELYTVRFKKNIGNELFKTLDFEVTANCDKTAFWKVKKKVPFPGAEDIFEVTSKRKIKASELWEKICYNAWADGCPGLINLSTARKYHNLEYVNPVLSTNPCLTGDTLVAVADGRIAVPFKQLAEENKDVPVYCRDSEGKVTTSMMRHPRITFDEAEICKVTTNDGNTIKATANHKILLSNGQMAEVCSLKQGDNIHILKRDLTNLEESCNSFIEHKIASVEYVGKASVYNGTVDTFHNYYFGCFKKTIEGKETILFTNGKNCGEQPIAKNSSCNLSSIVLPSFYKKDTNSIDYPKLKEVIHIAIRFSDNVIDNCEFPILAIKEVALKERRIGLGTMGVHDLLIKMKLGYDSLEGRSVVDELLKFLRDEAYKTSIEIAKEKGSFPLFDNKKFTDGAFIKTLPKNIQKSIFTNGIRNGTLTSQAPTGTIGTMYNCSTGCEPWFALSFQRNTRLGSYEDGCPDYIQWKKENPDKPKPNYFKTSQEISADDHIKMMILFSKYVCSAVSKTCNLPNSATVEDVKKAFEFAMEQGAKGITIFRDGSKEGVLISKDKKKEIIEEADKQIHTLQNMKEEKPTDTRVLPKKRGHRAPGATYRIHMQNHNLYVTANRNKDGELVEIFATVGESRKASPQQTSGVEDSWAEACGKLASLSLRAGVHPQSVARNLKNIPSDKPVFTSIGDNDSELIPSPPHAIARVIEEELAYSPADQGQEKPKEMMKMEGKVCSDCGSPEITPKGPNCYECRACGYSGCGS